MNHKDVQAAIAELRLATVWLNNALDQLDAKQKIPIKMPLRIDGEGGPPEHPLKIGEGVTVAGSPAGLVISVDNSSNNMDVDEDLEWRLMLDINDTTALLNYMNRWGFSQWIQEPHGGKNAGES